MPFRIVEVELDKHGRPIDRKVVHPSFDTEEEAIRRLESLISHYDNWGYDEKQKSWWVLAANGDRMTFFIEGM